MGREWEKERQGDRKGRIHCEKKEGKKKNGRRAGHEM